MNKKIAIILFGLSYKKYSKMGGTHVDFRKSVENYKKNIFSFFSNMGYDIDVFISTNRIDQPDILELLMREYKPKQYAYVDDIVGNIIFSKNEKLKKGLEICRDYILKTKSIYDIILVTRFDLLFKYPFEISNIKLDRFNVTSILETSKCICDNLYIMPYHMFDNFYKVICNNMTLSGHIIENDIKKTLNIKNLHYIMCERKHVRFLSFYEIVRNV